MGPVSPQTPDAAAAFIARRQHGNVTSEQLLACGVSETMTRWRVKTGRLFRVHRGVYAVGRPPLTPLEHAAAAALACGPGSALSHEGALALWGFTESWPASFDVVVVGADRRPKGIATHRVQGLTRHDLTVQRGIPVTSPARTLLDCAPRLPDRDRTRAVNDALRSPYLTATQLADVRHRFARHPGARLLDPFLDGLNPTASHLEDDFLAFCAHHGLPRPEVNVLIAGHLVDAVFPQAKVIVELDSWQFHSDRRAFETDRERDADTLLAGFVTVRLTSERMKQRPAAEAARLRQLISERS